MVLPPMVTPFILILTWIRWSYFHFIVFFDTIDLLRYQMCTCFYYRYAVLFVINGLQRLLLNALCIDLLCTVTFKLIFYFFFLLPSFLWKRITLVDFYECGFGFRRQTREILWAEASLPLWQARKIMYAEVAMLKFWNVKATLRNFPGDAVAKLKKCPLFRAVYSGCIIL